MEFDKNKVFTSVNADEVKVGSIGYFADTYADLKNLVVSNSNRKKHIYTITDADYIRRFATRNDGLYLLFYLLDEPKDKQYRPYKDVYELVDDILKQDIFYHKFVQSFEIRLRQKLNPSVMKEIVGFDFENNEVKIEKETWRSLEYLFNYYTFLDDSPCGVKEK